MSKGILHISKDALEDLVNKKVEDKLGEHVKNESRLRRSEERKRRAVEKELHEKNFTISQHADPVYFYKSKVDDKVEGQEDWMITYSDVITLLLTLFVLIFSLSKIDISKFEQMKASIDKQLLKKETQATSFAALGDKMKNIFIQYEMQNAVSVKSSARGLVLELSSNSLYDLGSAQIKPVMLPVLNNVAQAIQNSGFPDYIIEVDGHTDDIPIVNSNKYESNWELSTNRATNVVKYFIEQGVPKDRLRAAGYADSRPVLPNLTADGVPIPENRAKNRRVEILIQRQEE